MVGKAVRREVRLLPSDDGVGAGYCVSEGLEFTVIEP